MLNLFILGENVEFAENTDESDIQHTTLLTLADQNHQLPLQNNFFISEAHFNFSETLTTGTQTTEKIVDNTRLKKRCCLCNIF